jgi:nicotinamide-nucleotide amidase
MKATIITIGDEILLGQILDTNSQFIAKQLTDIGIETIEIRSVSDQKPHILRALTDAFNVSDAVFITGGLGPTKDDITKTALAEFFHTKLTFQPQVYAWLEEMFAAQPERLNDYNKTQAILPETCVALRNIKGTASGMWFEENGKVLVSLPGVPFETEYLFPAEVLPRLKAKFQHSLLRYRMLTVYNIPEAELAMQLANFENQLPAEIKLAYLPSPGFVRLRLTATGETVKLLDHFFSHLTTALTHLSFEETTEQVPAEISFAKRLKRAGVSVACAESCTGGHIAEMITAVAGSSAYFLGGVVAYANKVKESVLHVLKEDLEKYGAVSEPVARQMAEGVRKLTGADWAVSTTGIAGPDGGSDEKPVGTVWISVAGPKYTVAKKFLFSRTRERNIARASVAALQMLLDEIEKPA